MSAPAGQPMTPSRSTRAPLVAGVVLLVGAAIFAYGMLSGGGKAGAEGPRRGGAQGGEGALPVKVMEVAPGKLSKARRVLGEVRAERRALLRAEASGQVVRLGADLGDIVEPGALLVALDPGTLQAELLRAQATAEAAKARAEKARLLAEQEARDAARLEALRKDGAVSAGELDRARTESRAALAEAALAEAEERRAEAEVEVLRVRLAKTRVRAPFAGHVAALHVDEGSTVSAGAPVVEVVSSGDVHIALEVPEGLAGQVSVGDALEVRWSGAQLVAEVVRVGAALDPEKRTLPVKAVLKRPVAEASGAGSAAAGEVPEAAEARKEAPHLLPGMFVEVMLKSAAPEGALTVPLEALVGRGPIRTAYVVEEGKARAASVHVLLDDGKRAAIFGLEPGARVVVAGVKLLKDGQAVEVVP